MIKSYYFSKSWEIWWHRFVIRYFTHHTLRRLWRLKIIKTWHSLSVMWCCNSLWRARDSWMSGSLPTLPWWWSDVTQEFPSFDGYIHDFKGSRVRLYSLTVNVSRLPDNSNNISVRNHSLHSISTSRFEIASLIIIATIIQHYISPEWVTVGPPLLWSFKTFFLCNH